MSKLDVQLALFLSVSQSVSQSLLFYCNSNAVFMVIFAYFIATGDAQCIGIELTVNGQVFDESTLYRPIGHSGDFVTCRKCDDNINKPIWHTEDGAKLSTCKKTAAAVCFIRPDSRSRDLIFSAFQPSSAGVYECRLSGGFSKSINISILGQWVYWA